MRGRRELDDPRPGRASGVLAASGHVALLEADPPPAAPILPSYDRSGPAARMGRWFSDHKRAFAIYGASRAALLVLAVVCAAIFGSVVHGESVTKELANWDGWWYVRVATLGYGRHVSHAETTLGFFPLYPVVVWLTAHIFFSSYVVAGMIVSGVGGLVATIQVQKLTTEWWGPAVARKAVLFFCLFPGSIVFSMVYSEGLLIPLVAGCMLALSHKRWLLAGVLAGLASGIGPDSLVVVPMCLAAVFVQLRTYGWQDRGARRSMMAPLLAPFGAAAFAVFLWVWTGSPFASYIAQKYGWHEKTSPIALPHQVYLLVEQLGYHFRLSRVDPNIPVALLGTAFLVVGLRWLWRDRRTLPLEVQVFTWCMAFLMVTSWHVPPDPRLLITGFPVVLIFAKYVEGQAWRRMVWVTGALFLIMSALTYVGSIIRP